jgi:hypothetical protein
MLAVRRMMLPSARLLAAAALAWSAAGLAGEATQGHEHHHHHDHSALEVDAKGAPSVSLKAERDPMGGWNLRIDTPGFRFAPEHVNQAHVVGEGHAHLYVDGVKRARLYAPWFHLDALGAGEHRLRVTLNANSHQELHADGKPVQAEAVVRE